VKRQWFVVPLALAILVTAGAAAQDKDKKREAQLRTVRGAVVDKQDDPIASAVVYLRNVRTETVKTYIADDTGHYRFSGLDPNVDYEIHAEHGDLTSAKRTISSFDTRKDIVINLKVDKKKSEK
jgi:protocatechuate 3,4-dioxygenase beta subunit